MGGPRTSFVIATQNRAGELAQTITRLLNSTQCPIMVVDNASRDSTARVVTNIARSHCSRLQLITLRRNQGAAARNVGVAACETPFVAFCDDDSWWDPRATSTAEGLFDENPTLALLAAQTTVWPSGRRDSFTDVLADSALGRKPGLPGPSVLGFQCCSAIVRTNAFTAVGGFHPLLHIYGEEALLAMDLAGAGWDLCYCADLVTCHQPSKYRGSGTARDARELRNAFLTACMRRPVDRCAAALHRLLRAAATDSAHARAVLEALVRLPAALRQRRRLPAAVERQLRLLEAAS